MSILIGVPTTVFTSTHKISRKYTIETLCCDGNTSWDGWKVTRRYAAARDRDADLARLQVIETRGWVYRAGGRK